MKFYAVRNGRHPGIYSTWAECEQEIKGFAQAEFKSFKTKDEAKAFMNGQKQNTTSKTKGTNQGWEQPEILLFTDGGSRNHGNKIGDHVHEDDKAAWAFFIRRNGHNVRGVGGEFGATNNRMELMALRNALKILGQRGWNQEKINAILDSQYVLQPIQKGWLASWKKNGWQTSSGSPVVNQELWQEIDQLLPYFSQLKFMWTKGHADNRGNIIVDEMLNQKMDEM